MQWQPLSIGSHVFSFSTTRQVVPHNSTSFDNPSESLLNENHHLKERIDEFASNEKNLIEVNEDLQRQIQQLNQKERSEHEEISITNSIHMEQINSLNQEIERFRKDYVDLKEKFHADQHQSQKIIDQLREDIVDLDKTKQLYIGESFLSTMFERWRWNDLDVCHEKNSIEDKLRLKFEHEIKVKLDDLRRTLEKEFDERMQESTKTSQQRRQSEEDQLAERHAKDIERMKIQQEKTINELNLELDRLRANSTWETTHSPLRSLCSAFRRREESIGLHREGIRTTERWLLRFECETEGTAQFLLDTGTGESNPSENHRRHQAREERTPRWKQRIERRTSLDGETNRWTSNGIHAEPRLATDPDQ